MAQFKHTYNPVPKPQQRPPAVQAAPAPANFDPTPFHDPENLHQMGDFMLAYLCQAATNGQFFKFGTSIKKDGFLLQIGERGAGMRYELITCLEDLELLLQSFAS
jgi:hypothetical protein